MTSNTKLAEKSKEVLTSLVATLADYKNPVVLFSGGKDSMVMLHILLHAGIRFPLISFTDPLQPEKFGFVRKICELWGLVAYDYPPAQMCMLYGENGVASIVSHYTIGREVLRMPKDLDEYQDGDKKFLCGLEDYLLRPKGWMEFPWDITLIGHKDCDRDSVFGDIPLHTRLLKRENGPDHYFPLKDWTHEEVWNYIEEFHVPYQHTRYDIRTRSSLPDHTYNPDWISGVCIRCVDKRKKGELVACPKYNDRRPNISERVLEEGWKPDYFGKDK